MKLEVGRHGSGELPYIPEVDNLDKAFCFKKPECGRWGWECRVWGMSVRVG
ncbi:hypothetical protein ACFLU5_05515 [Bacteroidota bacterium]